MVKSLGERQKELNARVKEAALSNVDFEVAKKETERSDVDKLFKIDLASKHMNIEYIIEVLKSGDSLHISRALKCQWMYDDEFSNIINVDFLHNNVFPFMSLKMKKKLLTTVSTYVRNVDRASAFYKYCLDAKLHNIALKFIIFTSDEFKLEFIKGNSHLFAQLRYKNDFKHLIGSSFTLVDTYLSMSQIDCNNIKVLNEISYLYSVSDLKYLDMLEKHVERAHYRNPSRLGLRISKDILKNHKERVLKKPEIYINFLNKTSVVKYSTVENAKIYLLALLPNKVADFWDDKFCQTYTHILNIIPDKERFGLIKQMFNEKYPEQPFEMCINFYNQQCYKFMTVEEKENWALDQIASQKEILGIGRDYNWYKFVNFAKAFEEVKKLIMITPDNIKRAEMINILIDSAKNQRELETLFKYYYDRHNNEQRHTKENFIDCTARQHNVYEFDKECWAAFNSILQNLEVYSMLDYNCKSEFKIMALIYHVVNKLDVHDALKLYISTNMYFYTLKRNTDQLTKEQQEMVYQYLFKFYMDQINEYDSVPYDDEVKYKLRKYIYFILDLLHQYDRTKKDIPEVVTKLMKLDWDEFKCHKLHHEEPKKTTQEDLIRYLKKDPKLAVKNLPVVKKNIEISYRFHIGQFLKKLRVYFPNDISKEYLKFFKELLKESQLYPKVAQAAVYGIFQLADETYKDDFMKQHAPLQSKVNRSAIDEKLLRIQEAICATAFYSRPPVPLKNILLYVKGDYVRSCLPMFNSYLANLPLPICMEFVEAILNTPLSIQKHGLRLAFACFNAENLKRLVLYIWKKTKNISLRLIIYKALYNKIVDEDQNAQTALFETLSTFTLELHQDDDDELFNLMLSGQLPRHFISDHVTVVWKTVCKMPKNEKTLELKTNVISYMMNNIHSIRQDVIRPIVEEFVKNEFDTLELMKNDDTMARLISQKWRLTARHVSYVQSDDDLEQKLALTSEILNQYFTKHNLAREDKTVTRKPTLCYDFIQNLVEEFSYHGHNYFKYHYLILENILSILQNSLPIEEIYLVTWEIRIDVETRKAVIDGKTKLSSATDNESKEAIVRDILINYGKAIGCVIKEFVENKLYFKSFLNFIISILTRRINIIQQELLDRNYKGITCDDIMVITCLALMDFKMTEIYLFVLSIMPFGYNVASKYGEDFASILKEIEELNDIELKCVFNYCKSSQ
ncbi:uncharacterized protein LOC142983095 [Anticarsia gemmatalis]|uniref:uncharacterized protein LOC142983095 n=1 Tax=Anticarsia gemmatalis TaxID=129554 RepID=UPI003F77362C